DLDATFGEGDPGAALDALCDRAEGEVRAGARLLILSDRAISQKRVPLPMLLALGAVHQRLLQHGLRTRADLIVEVGDAWDVHHLAVLIGYGAGAVCPWLALRTVRALAEDEPARPSANGNGNGHERTSLHTVASDYPDADTAEHNYLKAADKGLLKIMSK